MPPPTSSLAPSPSPPSALPSRRRSRTARRIHHVAPPTSPPMPGPQPPEPPSPHTPSPPSPPALPPSASLPPLWRSPPLPSLAAALLAGAARAATTCSTSRRLHAATWPTLAHRRSRGGRRSCQRLRDHRCHRCRRCRRPGPCRSRKSRRLRLHCDGESARRESSHVAEGRCGWVSGGYGHRKLRAARDGRGWPRFE